MNERIPVSDGYITMNDKFKYLGSWVKDDLRDDHEVSVQIAKATAQMVMLRKYFNCLYVELEMKYRTHLAIPLNTVLWGYELWAISEGIKRRLSVFHHRSVRQILGIQKVHTAMFEITNEQTRMHFCNIPDIGETKTKRQLQWIGRVGPSPQETCIVMGTREPLQIRKTADQLQKHLC
jgi:hypothetical protein